MTALWIVLGIVGVLVLFVILTYNKLISLRNESQQGFSGIEVQLKRRADLIPNLVETVKGYAAHESATFEKVTLARQQAHDANGIDEVAQADKQMSSAIGGLLAISENYPDLQASQNFLGLQAELSDTEEKVASARRYYNSVVRRLNTKIQSFPSNIIAGLFNFVNAEFYEVEDDADRAPMNVSFAK